MSKEEKRCDNDPRARASQTTGENGQKRWTDYLMPGRLYMVVQSRLDGVALGMPEFATAARYYGVLIVDTLSDGAPLGPAVSRLRILARICEHEEDMLPPLYEPKLVSGDRNGIVVAGYERRSEHGEAVSRPQGWFLCEIR